MYRHKRCRNPYCREWLYKEHFPLCASCRFMGKVAFVFGSVIAGIISRFVL